MERQGAEAHHIPKEEENQAGEGWVRSAPKSRVKSLGLAATPEERGRWSPKQTELAEAWLWQEQHGDLRPWGRRLSSSGHGGGLRGCGAGQQLSACEKERLSH